MYRNKNTGLVLTDEEYWSMREREIKQLWKEMDEEERQDWGSFEVFRKRDFEDVDLDYKYIES